MYLIFYSLNVSYVDCYHITQFCTLEDPISLNLFYSLSKLSLSFSRFPLFLILFLHFISIPLHSLSFYLFSIPLHSLSFPFIPFPSISFFASPRDHYIKNAEPFEPEEFPVLLVGNKCDLSDKRAVTLEEVVDWCAKKRPRKPITYIGKYQ